MREGRVGIGLNEGACDGNEDGAFVSLKSNTATFQKIALGKVAFV